MSDTLTEALPWHADLLQQLEEITAATDAAPAEELPYLVVGFTAEEQCELVSRHTSSDVAERKAKSATVRKRFEHVRVVELASIDTGAASDKAGVDIHENDSPPADPDGKRLFDADAYEGEELQLPRVDGHGITKIQARFGGSPWLDRSDPRDVALIRDNLVGEKMALLVDVTVGAPVPGWTTNKKGDLDVLALTRSFVVTSVNRAASNLEPHEMLTLAVRRLLDGGRAIDEISALVNEAAETRAASEAD